MNFASLKGTQLYVALALAGLGIVLGVFYAWSVRHPAVVKGVIPAEVFRDLSLGPAQIPTAPPNTTVQKMTEGAPAPQDTPDTVTKSLSE